MTQRLLSFSSIDLFLNCERKWFWEKIAGEKSPETSTLAVGNVYHAAIAEARRHSERPLSEVCAEAIAAAAPRLKELGVSVEALQPELEHNLQRLREFLDGAEGELLPDGRPWLEQRFEDRELGYCGVIDWVLKNTPVVNDKGKITGWTPGRCIFDYKSLMSLRRRTERDARVSAQLGLYAIVTESRSAAFLEIPRDGSLPLQCRVVNYGPNDLRWMRTWLESMAAAIARRGQNMLDYPMTSRDNGLCSPAWCSFWFTCYPHTPYATQEQKST